MNIQWVTVAKSYHLNNDKTLDILGMFHHLNIVGGINKLPFSLIAKVDFDLLESSKNIKLTLQVKHDKKGIILLHDYQYKIPDMLTVSQSTTYITMNMSLVEFKYSGYYTFTLLVDDEYKNEEIIRVTVFSARR